MDYKKLRAELKANVISSAYLFLAEDRYIAMSFVKLLRERIASGEFASFNQSIFEEKKTDAPLLESALYALPVMSERRFVLIKCDTLGALSQNEGAVKVINNFIKSGCATTTLIILTSKADKRLSLYKTFASSAKIVEFAKLTERELYAWVNNTFGAKGFKASDKAVSKLIAYADYNGRDSQIDLGYVKNEIDKLCSYANGGEISEEMVEKICAMNLNGDIFKYTDSILAGDEKQALEALYNLTCNKMPAAVIMYNLSKVLANNALWTAGIEKGMTREDLAKKYGANPYIVKMTLKKSKMKPLNTLKAISLMNRSDMAVKGGKLKEDSALIILSKKLCSLAKL
ncbi:MAG: DNA polymerase III subunit delta [Eubacteriaceae bacterium]|nr:DNA polymerase III subunit delta [Eubacteriaceae bacterium]